MSDDYKVEPIVGEVWRYHVRSASHPSEFYLCDLEEYDFIGICGCAHWAFRLGPRVKLGERVRCKHLKICRDYAFDDIARRLQAELNRQNIL